MRIGQEKKGNPVCIFPRQAFLSLFVARLSYCAQFLPYAKEIWSPLF